MSQKRVEGTRPMRPKTSLPVTLGRLGRVLASQALVCVKLQYPPPLHHGAVSCLPTRQCPRGQLLPVLVMPLPLVGADNVPEVPGTVVTGVPQNKDHRHEGNRNHEPPHSAHGAQAGIQFHRHGSVFAVVRG